MNHRVSLAPVLFTPVLLFLMGMVLPAGATAQSTVCDAYRKLDFDTAIKLSDSLQEAGIDNAAKVDGYMCRAATLVAQRNMDGAREAIANMLALDPTARFSPDYEFPPPVIELYHVVREAMEPAGPDIRTVAIGDFEDNSIYVGGSKDLDTSRFAGVLVHTITADLAAATPLRIVDRQRTRTLLDEIELSQSGVVGENAAQAGKLLGAQTYIFGQYVILDKKTVRIDARVVHTETGEIILTRQVTGEFAGKAEKFLALEKELVLGLAAGIESILSGAGDETDLLDPTEAYFKTQESSVKGRKAYVEAKFLIAEALEMEDAGNYTTAADVWKRVLEKDPENEVAEFRLNILETLALNRDN